MSTPNLALPLLDALTLEEIRALDDASGDELVREVVTAYLSSSPELIAKLREGMTSGDSREVKMAAHTLKSSSANVGAKRLSELCRTVEHRANEGDLSGGMQVAEAVEGCYRETCVALTTATATQVANA